MRTQKTPTETSLPFIRVRKIPPNSVVIGQPLSTSHLVFIMHRFERRTLPCYRPSFCAFCDAGIATDERIYLALWCRETHQQFVLDLPTTAHSFLNETEVRFGSLDKTVIAFHRDHKFNGPLRYKAAPVNPELANDDDRPDIEAIVDHLTRENAVFAFSLLAEEKTSSKFGP